MIRSQKHSVIVEQDGEESEVSAVNITTGGAEQVTQREIEEKTEVINKYKRIDQTTLTKVGLREKQRLTEHAIPHVF